METRELCSGSPYPQSRHVRHVPRLRGARGTAVHDPRLWQSLLELEHREARLARLAGPRRYQVLGLVALIKHYLV